jgi:hypothetical protein
VQVARELDGAVLDNFWYADTVDELLAALPRQPIVEVSCRSDPEVACERFRRRARHPGHTDDERDPDSVRAPFFSRARMLPLATVGPVVEVDTERPVDVATVVTGVVEAANRARRA